MGVTYPAFSTILPAFLQSWGQAMPTCNVLALETQVHDFRPPQISALADFNMIALEGPAMRGGFGRHAVKLH